MEVVREREHEFVRDRHVRLKVRSDNMSALRLATKLASSSTMLNGLGTETASTVEVFDLPELIINKATPLGPPYGAKRRLVDRRSVQSGTLLNAFVGSFRLRNPAVGLAFCFAMIDDAEGSNERCGLLLSPSAPSAATSSSSS